MDAHPLVMPIAPPLTAAVESGVLGPPEDLTDEAIAGMTQEQVNEALTYLRDLDYLDKCKLEGLDPRTGNLPRGKATPDDVARRIADEHHRIAESLNGCMGAYADAFGREASEALEAYAREAHRRGIMLITDEEEQTWPPDDVIEKAIAGDRCPLLEWLSENDPEYARIEDQLAEAESEENGDARAAQVYGDQLDCIERGYGSPGWRGDPYCREVSGLPPPPGTQLELFA